MQFSFMSDDDASRLFDSVDALERVAVYIQNVSQKEFCNSMLLQDAVIRRLAIVGECVGKFSPDLRNRLGDVPLRAIRAFRNRVIHDYAGVDPTRLWHVASVSAPDLLVRLRAQLDQQ
jgi:uncharacterized protein with HEPN domain